MHKEVLAEAQIKLLPLVGKFVNGFGLVGGTAIALQIGHRRSIDFDLFALKQFNKASIRKIVTESGQKIDKVLKDEAEQFTFLVNGVQFTFLYYPFNIKFSEKFENKFKMPDLLTLAAMKAYALGRRAKWKDYVDLYFIINKYHSIEKIIKKSKAIFDGEFNERIFREQLGYFDDMDYSEEIDFLPGQKAKAEKIKKELVQFSLE